MAKTNDAYQDTIGTNEEWNEVYKFIDKRFPDEGVMWRQCYYIIAESRMKNFLSPAETREILDNILYDIR